MPSEIAKRMGRPRLTPGIGPSGLVTVRIPDEQRQAMEDAAARARLSLSAFIRQSGLWWTAPDVLREMLRKDREERERNASPAVMKDLDELRKKIKAVRRRSR